MLMGLLQPIKYIRSENNLCCQVCAVIHSKLLTEFELQAIEQLVLHHTSSTNEVASIDSSTVAATAVAVCNTIESPAVDDIVSVSNDD